MPLQEIEKEIQRQIVTGKNATPRERFVFRGFPHKKLEDFLKFIAQFGQPEFILALTCKDDIVKQRFLKKEGADEINEEQQADLLDDSKVNKKIRTDITAHFKEVPLVEIDTGKLSMEAVARSLASRFASKIILVNHEPSLRSSVDTACSNLSIKYNCLYISIY